MPRKLIDLSVPLRERRAGRSAGLRAEHPLFRSQADRGRGLQVLPGPDGRGTARRRRLGDRVDQALDPQRHASRCALPFRLDHGPRQARHHHRRGADRLVPAAGGQARLPAFSRRLCGDREGRRGRAQAHRPHALAARDRGGEHQRRRGLRQARLRRHRLRHGPGGDALSAGARRAGHRHRRLELGRALRPHQGEICADPRRRA